jgi:hypothetical protein
MCILLWFVLRLLRVCLIGCRVSIHRPTPRPAIARFDNSLRLAYAGFGGRANAASGDHTLYIGCVRALPAEAERRLILRPFGRRAPMSRSGLSIAYGHPEATGAGILRATARSPCCTLVGAPGREKIFAQDAKNSCARARDRLCSLCWPGNILR